jgi:site-specific recombinase XerD
MTANEAREYRVRGLPPNLSKQVISFFDLNLARGFSKRTIRAYAYDLVVFLRFYRGRRRQVPSFRSVDVKTLIEFIKHEKSRNAAPRSINRRLNTVDVFYRHCYDQLIPGTRAVGSDPRQMRGRRYLTMDSTLGVFPIYAKSGRTLRMKVPHELIRVLEPDEVEAFLDTMRTHRDRAIVILMLACGLRSSEVLSLELDDINPFSKTLRIRGKGNKERVIPIPAKVLEILDHYLERERPIRKGREKDPAVFLTLKGPKRGMPMTLEGLRGLFRYKRAISGIAHANPHRFRHTFGRNMVAGGMSLPALQRILGHNDHRTTIRYINLTLKDVHEDFERASETLRTLDLSHES